MRCSFCITQLNASSPQKFDSRAPGCAQCFTLNSTAQARACEACLLKGVKPRAFCVNPKVPISELVKTNNYVEFVLSSKTALWDQNSLRFIAKHITTAVRSIIPSTLGAKPTSSYVTKSNGVVRIALESKRTVSYLIEGLSAARPGLQKLTTALNDFIPCGYKLDIHGNIPSDVNFTSTSTSPKPCNTRTSDIRRQPGRKLAQSQATSCGVQGLVVITPNP